MYVYEKIKLDEHLPIKILDLYYESSEENVEKHWHNSIEILVPIENHCCLTSWNLWLVDGR